MQTGDIHFNAEELSRYNRHIIIPGFGLDAQKKLKAAKVLVVGCGGLGSPVLLYLAAAGIGTIGIVDFDLVDDSNLQRQVLFGVEDIGLAKVEAARKKLEDLNPHIHFYTHNTKLTSENAMDIMKNYDLVADGTDNFPTRYLINDACVLLDKPYVYASIHQFEGQVSVFNYKDTNGDPGPNYRDLYPVPPPPGLVQDCAQGGVLGVLPGIIGSMQALEVIKVITGLGETLSGQFYMFDALHFESRMLKIKRDPGNPLNGTKPTIQALIDYEQFCGAKAVEKSIKEITPKELKQWIGEEDIQVIDVREPYEYEMMNIGAQLIPLNSLEENVHQIDKVKKVVVHCKSGTRSAQAIRELQQKFGFDNLYNLKGGIIAYLEQQ
jgi:sulfur-carrier protein adenylyltransferase/sulfurtransferase